jgi:hypothetical protein
MEKQEEEKEIWQTSRLVLEIVNKDGLPRAQHSYIAELGTETKESPTGNRWRGRRERGGRGRRERGGRGRRERGRRDRKERGGRGRRERGGRDRRERVRRGRRERGGRNRRERGKGRRERGKGGCGEDDLAD